MPPYQWSFSPVLRPSHTPELWQRYSSINAVLCMHTGALSGADVQPRLCTCGIRVALVWRSLVSIKSSSRAHQAHMVQAHTRSPSLPPSPLGWQGHAAHGEPLSVPGATCGTCMCCNAPGSGGHQSHGALSPAPASTCGGDRRTDREMDAGWGCRCFQRGSRTHAGPGVVFRGRD